MRPTRARAVAPVRRNALVRAAAWRLLAAPLLVLVLVLAPGPGRPVHAAAPAPAQGPGDDAVDRVALAELLSRDGEYARAEAVLAGVDAETMPDPVRYHGVRGLLALRQQRPQQALQAFEAALAAAAARDATAPPEAAQQALDPMLHLHHAQALFALQRHAPAVAALDAAGTALDALPGAWLLRAQALWLQGRHQPALDTLARGEARFAAHAEFRRRQVFHLIELGLHARAVALGRVHLADASATALDHIALGTALRRAGDLDAALRLLEDARLRFPADGAVVRALAQAWVERGNPLAAAELLARQALSEPVLYPEAAELLRRAGWPMRALALNARIADQPRKLHQRVGILTELQHHAEVVAMEDALHRAGLLEDQQVRYALAYAHFHGRDFDAVERHLRFLTEPELFRRATELRRLMQEAAAADAAPGARANPGSARPAQARVVPAPATAVQEHQRAQG